jgi:ABC-type branched-subunit amino acid transport system substrate-binding protein
MALVAVLLVVAAACGDDEEGEETPTGTATAAATETAAVTGTATAEASPTDVGDVPGITATEIKLGSHKPLTGVAASYAIISDGENAYFDYVNEEEGGVCGRKIVVKTEDDQYTASKSVEAVRRLVEDEKVYQDLNDQGIPDMYINSGSKKWSEDPETYRYIFAGFPTYQTAEGPMMGEFIAENWPGAKVGLFVQGDDFGDEIEIGVKEGLAGTGEIVDKQTYTTGAPDIRSQLINLRDAGAEVVAMAAIPEFAAFFIQSARGQGWDVPIVASGVIADPVVFQLAGASNVFDVWVPAVLVPPSETDNPGIAEYHRIMETYAPGVDAERGVVLYGYANAELLVETIRRACDNLTRDGLVEAAESINGWEQGVAWGPITMSPTDHAPREHAKWAKADPETSLWVPFGDVISKETTQ